MPDNDKESVQSKPNPLLGLDGHAVDHIYFMVLVLVAIAVALIYGIFSWIGVWIKASH